MVTGMRRAELLVLRWTDVDLAAGVLTARRNYVQAGGKSIEKDTKTHQMRRLALDPATVEVLTEHHDRYQAVCWSVGVDADPRAFLFSYRPDFDRPCNPSRITHRYAKMCVSLGIDSHLHALRHYSVTELLTAGVDLRTVAGRLGHGGGGEAGRLFERPCVTHAVRSVYPGPGGGSASGDACPPAASAPTTSAAGLVEPTSRGSAVKIVHDTVHDAKDRLPERAATPGVVGGVNRRHWWELL
jgi:hypothetical protein